MVDAVVSFAVEKLGNAIIEETYFLHGVRDQVESLRDELKRMQCFLEYADAKEQQDDIRVRNWVKDIRDLSYDAEDVIDTFILKVDSTRKVEGISNFLSRKASMIKNLGLLHRVGNKILALQARLRAISESRITYGIKDLGNNEASISRTQRELSLRNRYPHVIDDDVIGFEKHTKRLLTELMKDEERRCVVSIVGVGGLGKTTLAKEIYRHEKVKSHFDCSGWSSISQQLNVKEALQEIGKKCMKIPEGEFQKVVKKLNDGELTEKIYNYLQDKRYFVVLDDVWDLDHWKCLSYAFPTGKRGSKVLLTTRNKAIASGAASSLQLEPELLNEEESWELLCRKSCLRNRVEVGCYPDLEKLGRKMVRKCGGLPLGICVLGGILATKEPEIKQWELVHTNVTSYDGGVNAILALSYYDLPSHLKRCFLYLGLFPEDYEIPTEKLIQLWIAEGFIPQTEDTLMEDIGEHEYLAELAQRCMIQISYVSCLRSSCRLHDLMRDFCLSKAEEINFLSNCRIQMSNPVIADAGRRVRSFATHLINNVDYKESAEINCVDINFKSDCAIRTLLVVFPYEESEGYPLAPINFQYIKLLRVLDLEKAVTVAKHFTKDVSKLLHLRYLDLGNIFGFSVSPSIGNLQNLQTLKLEGHKGNLPSTVSKLVQLRHLIISTTGVDRYFRIENLINLQTISMPAGEWIRKGCFEKLSNIRELSVHDTTKLQTDIIIDEVVRKGCSPSSSSSDSRYQIPIRSLDISTDGGFPSSIFDSLSRCHNLQLLGLHGALDLFSLQNYPPNLTHLNLIGTSFIEEDPMRTLQYLPKLATLILLFPKTKEEMVCSSDGFPQLKNLRLFFFLDIKQWRVEQGGMPQLKELYMTDCSKLSMLPEGLKFITTLEELTISRSPLLKERVAKGGEDWYKVQHIPSVSYREVTI